MIGREWAEVWHTKILLRTALRKSLVLWIHLKVEFVISEISSNVKIPYKYQFPNMLSYYLVAIFSRNK